MIDADEGSNLLDAARAAVGRHVVSMSSRFITTRGRAVGTGA